MGHKILVIDDAAETRDLLCSILEGAGYQVVTAGEGNDGLAKARAETPDVILLDLMLPQINGFKICRILKFDAKYRKIFIIMLTARSDETEEKTAYEVGADVYMHKPIQADVILKTIGDFLTLRDKHRGLSSS